MPSPSILNARVKKLTPENQIYFSSFLNFIKEKKESTQANYRSQVVLFLEHFNEIPIEQIELIAIQDYLRSIENARTRINTSRYLKIFIENSNLPKLKFGVNDLLTVNTEKPDDVKSDRPLSIVDIIEFRNKLSSEEDYEALFVFEMLYLYGIKWKQFEEINKDSYSEEKDSLSFGSDKTIKLNETLRNLLRDHPELLAPKKRGALSGYIKDAGKSLGRRLTETDIEETRKKYFPVCHMCNESYPNIDEFWALVEYENDLYHKKWLVCIDCAKKTGGK